MRNVLLPILLLLAAQPLAAKELCEGGPRDQWLSEAMVAELITQMGYSTDEYLLMIEDGCLEAKLIHKGERVEIYFEPITGEVVRIKQG